MTRRKQQKKERKTNISRARCFNHPILSYGRVWVIPDIHSCFHTLRALLERLPATSDTLFVFLGDYINKGKYPEATLDFLISFSNLHNCFFIRGNHDQMLLDAWNLGDKIYIDQIVHLGSVSLLDSREVYEGFLQETCHYIETENHYFVHAGFDFSIENPFLDIERMMMIREVNYNRKKANNKTVVRGHYPVSLEEVIKTIDQKVICLDNGCVYTTRTDMGNLVALELHSSELIVQRNVD